MIDAIDSHVEYVKAQLATINASRKLLGVMDAQDWPPETVVHGALYCLVLGSSPAGPQSSTTAIPVLVHVVQWTYLLWGTDIQAGLQGRNRGDRYRQDWTIRDELRRALAPNFCEKKTWSLSSNTLVSTSFDPKEYIKWTQPQFGVRSMNGVITGTVTVYVTDMTEVISV